MTFEEMLSALAQQTMQINASLEVVAAGVANHDAQMRVHAERIRQNEETLRQTLITQQAIKDILERLNGR
jgi:hypothetical protein